MEDENPKPEPRDWLLDGYNVLHACLLAESERREWWTAAHRERLVDRVRRFTGAGTVWVVFDGDRPAEPQSSERVRVVFAPSADDWLLRRVREATASRALGVVTADRKVADRCRARGAHVVHPRDFLARCEAGAGLS